MSTNWGFYIFVYRHQILAALAVPLNDRKDVFVSYNFEANYNSPAAATDYIPGPLTRVSCRVFIDIKKRSE